MTFKAESSWSESHITTTIIPFDFYCNASSSLAPIWSFGFFFDLHTCLLALRTWHLIVYATELAGHLCGMFCSGIICKSFTCWGMKLHHPRTSPSSEERPVGWMQPDLFSYVVLSFVIKIGQDILTRRQKSDTSKARLDGTGPWELPRTTGSDICICLEWFWNDWELGRAGLPWVPDKDLTEMDCFDHSAELDCFETQIRTQ